MIDQEEAIHPQPIKCQWPEIADSSHTMNFHPKLIEIPSIDVRHKMHFGWKNRMLSMMLLCGEKYSRNFIRISFCLDQILWWKFLDQRVLSETALKNRSLKDNFWILDGIDSCLIKYGRGDAARVSLVSECFHGVRLLDHVLYYVGIHKGHYLHTISFLK